MAQPSAQEKKLLDLSKAFDDAISTPNTAKLDELLADNVIVHRDSIGLQADLHGKADVKQWLQSYSDKYEFKHEAIAGAVNDQENATFSFWQDTNVTPKPGKFNEQLPPEALKPSTTVGIWYHDFDSSNKIKEIWYLRQMSADEVHRKLKHDVPQKLLPVKDWRKSDIKSSADRRKDMGASAMVFNDIWAKRDPDAADTIMVKDVKQWDPVLGKELKGLEDFKNLIKMYSKNWEPKSNTSHVAASAGNKAFVHWISTVKHLTDGKEETIYGLNMLVFNDDGKITEIVGFRQPSANEAQQLVK